MEEGFLNRIGLPAVGAVLCFGAAFIAWNSATTGPESAEKPREAPAARITEANWDVRDDGAYVSARERELLGKRDRARADAAAKKFGNGSLLDDSRRPNMQTAVAVPDETQPGVWKVE